MHKELRRRENFYRKIINRNVDNIFLLEDDKKSLFKFTSSLNITNTTVSHTPKYSWHTDHLINVSGTYGKTVYTGVWT